MLFKKKHQKAVTPTDPVGVIRPASGQGKEESGQVDQPPKSSKKLDKKLLGAGLIIVLLVAGGFYYKSQNISKTDTNKSTVIRTETDRAIDEVNVALQAGDTKKALEKAQIALAASPEDLYTLELTASLTKPVNPEEAKKLYARALEIFVKNDDPSVDGKTFATYMSAGGLAENAGKIDQAILYYQKAIDSAQPVNPMNEAIIKDAQERLARLR